MRLRLIGAGLLTLVLGATAFGMSKPVLAGNSDSDRIYADSFGNLVVHSRNGSKRIVVGQGALAKELADYVRTQDPTVAYADSGEESVPYECWKPAVLLKGRSYMYGLEDGELPDLPGKWCGLPEHAAPGAAIRRVQP